jgi:trimeric autotransporter adhesin
MSTKTTFKRIALATVAAMGFGLLSVVPANAANGDITGVVTLGTLPTGQAVAGTAVTVSPTIATSAITTSAAGATFVTTANISTAPAHSALASATALAVTSSVATKATTDTNGTVAAAVATGNSTTTGAKITFTQVSATATQTAAVMGAFSFTPDVAGYYVLTLSQTSTAATVGGAAASAVTTATLTVGFTVSGGALIQIGASAAPKTTGTQVTGRDVTAVFFLPQSAATTSRYKVSATGATITGVFAGADATNAVDATTYTDAATGIVKNDGTGYAQGVTYQPARAGTAPASGAASTNSFAVRFTSATAGAGTVLVQSVDAATGVLTTVGTVTVTFGAAAVVSPTQSTAHIGQGNARPSTAETTAIRVPSTAAVALSSTATSGATIAVDVKDADGSPLVNQAITATITGSGLITLANDSAGNGTGSSGTVRTASLTATTMASSSKAIIGVSADGTRGVGTITITAGGVTIATKTVTFYGAVATLTATQGVSIMASGRTATSDAATFVLGNTTAASNAGLTATTAVNLRIVAADVDGNVVPLAGSAISADISDVAVIDQVTITDCAGTALTANSLPTICAVGAGNFVASTRSAIGGTSGAKATVTFKTAHLSTGAGTCISTACASILTWVEHAQVEQ